jgi:hypothetical protein
MDILDASWTLFANSDGPCNSWSICSPKKKERKKLGLKQNYYLGRRAWGEPMQKLLWPELVKAHSGSLKWAAEGILRLGPTYCVLLQYREGDIYHAIWHDWHTRTGTVRRFVPNLKPLQPKRTSFARILFEIKQQMRASATATWHVWAAANGGGTGTKHTSSLVGLRCVLDALGFLDPLIIIVFTWCSRS